MRPCNRLAIALALCAMALRALLPSGFMPAVDANGGVTLILCTTQGVQAFSPDAIGKTGGAHHEQCPFGFALSISGAVADAPAVCIDRDPVSEDAPSACRTDAVSRTAYEARGPPAALA